MVVSTLLTIWVGFTDEIKGAAYTDEAGTTAINMARISVEGINREKLNFIVLQFPKLTTAQLPTPRIDSPLR